MVPYSSHYYLHIYKDTMDEVIGISKTVKYQYAIQYKSFTLKDERMNI